MVRRKAFMLTLVRHGETEFNRQGFVQGQAVETAGTALNETGKSQARALGRWLAEEKYTHVYSSDQVRAKQTCEIILSENAAWKIRKNESGVGMQFDSRLRERRYGAMEGQRRNEYYEQAKSMGFSLANFVPDGAETISELGHRADEFFTDLCQTCYSYIADVTANHDNEVFCGATTPNVLVVSHGRLLATLMSKFSEKYGCSFPPGKLGVVSVNTGRSCFIVEFTKHFEFGQPCQNSGAGNISMRCTVLGNGDHLNSSDTDQKPKS